MNLDTAMKLASVAGLGAVLLALLTHRLKKSTKDERRQIETDLATYKERTTTLISSTLCAFIRSNRHREGERDDLAQLIRELSDGAHQARFLDPAVQEAWKRFVIKSAEYGWRRLAEAITETDIADYTRAWEAWLHAARRSFGPLPALDQPVPRRS